MKHIVIAALLLASSAFAQEDRLISILKSDAPLKEKADACRELAHVGTRQAVPVLGPLLMDEKLSHWARYALEPIADPSVDAALLRALGKLQGSMLVGVIDSLGVRKDTKAVAVLDLLLRDTDPAVAQAAARSLGSMGAPTVQLLERTLPPRALPQYLELAVCEGLFRCAEAMPDSDSLAIYDRLRRLPKLPHQVQVAALRGAILRRGAKGVGLLVETIRADSSALSAAAMGISMDMPDAPVTRALAGELPAANQQKRLLLLQTLGNRGDASAAPALEPLAQAGSIQQRSAAIRSLVQLANPSSVPVLAALVKDTDATVSNAARAGLIGFPSKAADTAVLALLDEPGTRVRIAAMDMAGQRRLHAALPLLLKATDDARSDVVAASFKTLGELAGVAEIPAVVDAMLKTKALRAAESALSAICARQADKSLCSPKLMPGLSRAQGQVKLALLRVLHLIGDARALTALRAAATESDRAVRDGALRALCDWPTVQALPDLAQIAKTTKRKNFKILALRGQLRLIPMQTDSDAQKLTQLKVLLPLLERKEEERLVLATLGGLPSAESLALVMSFVTQAGLKEEASVAAVTIAEKITASHSAQVAEAMKQVSTNNSKVAKRAEQLLARVPKDALEDGFASIFNGKDLTGWDAKPGWWRVENGALTAESTPEKPCKKCNYLFWRGGQPANFELLADFKLSAKGNSGIQIRSEPRPDWDTYGYQADMTGDGELIGFVYHHKYALIAGRGTKAVFTADNASTVEKTSDPAALLKHYKQGDWNTYRVVCHGPDITLYINGVLMCQITDHRVAETARHGVIALQMHPGPPMKVQFKNIRIKATK
jgi:HEAT repeat protein